MSITKNSIKAKMLPRRIIFFGLAIYIFALIINVFVVPKNKKYLSWDPSAIPEINTLLEDSQHDLDYYEELITVSNMFFSQYSESYNYLISKTGRTLFDGEYKLSESERKIFHIYRSRLTIPLKVDEQIYYDEIACEGDNCEDINYRRILFYDMMREKKGVCDFTLGAYLGGKYVDVIDYSGMFSFNSSIRGFPEHVRGRTLQGAYYSAEMYDFLEKLKNGKRKH